MRPQWHNCVLDATRGVPTLNRSTVPFDDGLLTLY